MMIKGVVRVQTDTSCFEATVDLLLRTDIDGRSAYRGSMHTSAKEQAKAIYYASQPVQMQVDGVMWDIVGMQVGSEGVVNITTIGGPYPL